MRPTHVRYKVVAMAVLLAMVTTAEIKIVEGETK